MVVFSRCCLCVSLVISWYCFRVTLVFLYIVRLSLMLITARLEVVLVSVLRDVELTWCHSSRNRLEPGQFQVVNSYRVYRVYGYTISLRSFIPFGYFQFSRHG